MAGTDLNSVILIGRLTRDAELSYLQSGMAVCAMSIAVNRRRREGEQWIDEVNFFDVSYFGKAAEAVKSYLTKGKQVAIQGSLKQDRWEKDGQKFNKVRIMASSVELLGGRSDNGGAGFNGAAPSGGYQSNSGYSNSGYAPRPQAPVSQGYDAPMDDSFGGDNGGFPEDIPF